jgi:pimeloyl-ACP methyl ester carboxylesterase
MGLGLVAAGQITAFPEAQAETKPRTFVLVHGAWHGGWCWRRVADRLSAKGHYVVAPTLSGVGERSHLPPDIINLTTQINDVAGEIKWKDLDNIILVGHSYGGMVITGAADRAPDRVGRLVYLDAATPVNGQSLLDIAGPMIAATRPLGQVVDGVELVLLPTEGAGRFYGVEDPADLKWMDDRLAGHPWKCFEQPLELTNEDALWAIPQYHVVCTSTLATRDRDQMAAARAEGRLWDIDTGHDLMITEPERVAAVLGEIASA